ncbi:PspC domain-containing protein [Agromyces archimandritae]|uniref:PspC domain-containing protein n=1 Tax=Agromyces archimandritae TaxID=2781962 RepID=A0A975FL08_9MICO|nr:PspC domain-containing protein [Agromyces archimandritae]QTX03692.1 PspC domain-containing protein [Agromyces archimandritae]
MTNDPPTSPLRGLARVPASISGEDGGAGRPGGDTGDAPANGSARLRFFDWVRTLDVERRDGWLGGVCAGVAARIGIDPLIVRGIVVVAAIFASPVVFVYLLGWMLLPDRRGRIHLEELFAARFDATNIALLVLAIASLALSTQNLIGSASMWLDSFWWPLAAVAVSLPVVGILLVAGLVVLVVWIARRAERGPASRSGWMPRAPLRGRGPLGGGRCRRAGRCCCRGGARSGGGCRGHRGIGLRGCGERGIHRGVLPPAPPRLAGRAHRRPGRDGRARLPVGPPPAPPVRPVNASDDELEAWRRQHEAWKAERAAWKADVAEADRRAKEHWAEEYRAGAADFARQSAEAKRARRAARPRAGFAFVATLVGAALLVGAFLAIGARGTAEIASYAVSVGLVGAGLVVSLGMIVAGVMRRRSGFLAFLAAASLVVGIGAAAIPRNTEVLWPSAYVSLPGIEPSYTQPFGALWISDNGWTLDPGRPFATTIDKNFGDVGIDLQAATPLEVVVELGGSGVVRMQHITPSGEATDRTLAGTEEDGVTRYRIRTAGDSEPVGTLTVRIRQQGDVTFTIWEQE